VLFIICLFVVFIIYLLTYFVTKKVIRKDIIFKYSLIVGFVLLITTYIEGNYLAGMLPSLNGSAIIWSNYTKASIISFAVLVVVSVITGILIKKIKLDKTITSLKYVSLAIGAMLLVSLLTTTMTSSNLNKDINVTATTKNLENYSDDENFIIFLLDAVDSRTFNKIIQEKKYNKILKDFTYYPDTMSAYPFTRDSIPFILSGIWNNNEEEFAKYYSQALDNSELLKKLYQNNYDVNIYDTEIIYNSKNAKKIQNLTLNNNYDFRLFANQEIKYSLFKYLPFYLKKYSHIESMDFNKTKIVGTDIFDLSDVNYYSYYLEKQLVKKSEKQFKFIHLEGGHVPFNLDENVNYISNGAGTYDQKLESSIKIVEKYLDKLKKNDVYNNSNIIIMSDHGFNFDETEGRQNPILYIKGKNEEHKKMNISDKAISYTDLNDAYTDLLNGKKSNELFKDITDKRERRYLLYAYTKEDHMVEYTQTGKAWDLNTLVKTGKEFNR
ncbi:MAG: sulfatase-like hydrolase/transferase, partial [Bacilli bacterium]|nr:sulfatase-like hydrolase/transferase [Bacilli bacterium]